MDETVWVYRETLTLVRVASSDGDGPDGVPQGAGARLGWIGTGLLLAALGIAGARLAVRRGAAVRPATSGGSRALEPGRELTVDATRRAA